MPDGQRGVPVVPHIVRPRDAIGGDMRRELGIAPSTTVFGRYGGADTFSIDFAQSAVVDVAKACPESVVFLFMNTLRL